MKSRRNWTLQPLGLANVSRMTRGKVGTGHHVSLSLCLIRSLGDRQERWGERKDTRVPSS